MLSVIGDDRNRLPIVAGQHPCQERAPTGLKGNTITDPKLQHLPVGTHLVQKTKTLHDPVIEIDQFCLGEFVNVDLHPCFFLLLIHFLRYVLVRAVEEKVENQGRV